MPVPYALMLPMIEKAAPAGFPTRASSSLPLLGRVYAKLCIRSRAELDVRMGTQGAGPGRDEG